MSDKQQPLVTDTGKFFTRDSEMHLTAHLHASKSYARKLTLQLIAEGVDSEHKARAANIISLLTDAEEQLKAITEYMGWN